MRCECDRHLRHGVDETETVRGKPSNLFKVEEKNTRLWKMFDRRERRNATISYRILTKCIGAITPAASKCIQHLVKYYATCFAGCVASCGVLNRLNTHVSSLWMPCVLPAALLAAVPNGLRAHNAHTHYFTRCFTHTQHTHSEELRQIFIWFFFHIRDRVELQLHSSKSK